jgi:DNA-binding LacI/PurR family transcriptional regulator
MLTAALYPLLRARGIEPERDLAIVSCNNETSILSTLYPRPPSVDLHIRQIGEAAVDQLLKRLDTPTSPTVTLAFKPKLHVPAEMEIGTEVKSEPLPEMSLHLPL